MVWFRVNQSGRRPVMIKMSEDQNVFEALKAAKPDLDLHVALEWVTVMFNGKVVWSDAPISQYENASYDNLLLLEFPEPEGKLHAVIYLMLLVVCGPYGLVPQAWIRTLG